MNIWIISDTHFGHLNMIHYCRRPQNFDEVIISNWNKVVQPDDLVIHLGDVIMGQNSSERLPDIMKQLNGRKILCRGNHDIEKNWGNGVNFMEKGFDMTVDYFVYDIYAFSHCPLTPLPKQADLNWEKTVELNIHGHFHNSSESQQTKTDTDNRFYNRNYYVSNRNKYHLIQIEDELRPFSLEEVLASWLGGESNET